MLARMLLNKRVPHSDSLAKFWAAFRRWPFLIYLALLTRILVQPSNDGFSLETITFLPLC